jgi:hypothetical protein
MEKLAELTAPSFLEDEDADAESTADNNSEVSFDFDLFDAAIDG